jgi:6-pyruvoyl tetrahydropterin synthase-like protein
MQVIEEKRYKLKRFIAIRHSYDGNTENLHAHTIAINCSIRTETEDVIDYRKVEDIIQRCLDKYENKYLNDLPEFKDNATIERLGEVLCFEIDEAMKEINYEMDRFEIGETPLRVYVITNELRD